MEYYVLEGTFSEELPDQIALQKTIDAHLAYLDHGFNDGSILVSGPKVGAGGGVIVVKCDDIQKFCNEDPLVRAGIQKCRIIEFELHRCQEPIRTWF